MLEIRYSTDRDDEILFQATNSSLKSTNIWDAFGRNLNPSSSLGLGIGLASQAK